MDKIKIYVNLGLIILIVALFFWLFQVNNLDKSLTAKVIDSPDNIGINSQIQQLKEGLSFSTSNLSYSFSENCSEKNRQNMLDAFKIIVNETNITFYQAKNSADIRINCLLINGSKLAEGGPTLMTDKEILEGKIVLYNNSLECTQPIAELHELLHVLGFIHTTRESSIMYPLADCNQKIDSEIIDILNKEY